MYTSPCLLSTQVSQELICIFTHRRHSISGVWQLKRLQACCVSTTEGTLLQLARLQLQLHLDKDLREAWRQGRKYLLQNQICWNWHAYSYSYTWTKISERQENKAERCGRAVPMPMASPEAPPSMEAALSSRASSRALPGCCLVPPAL